MLRTVGTFFAATLLSFLFLFVGCSERTGIEESTWQLEFFTKDGAVYSVGDLFEGERVGEDFYSCTFGGGKYAVCHEGAPFLQGTYTAREAGEGSVMLALEQEGGTLYWNCGIRTDESGAQTVAVTGSAAGITFSFVAA